MPDLSPNIPYIEIDQHIPGIRSLVIFRPETGKPLYELAQVLLRGANTLSEAERELIAAYVSHLNGCRFCANSHAAAARCLYGDNRNTVDAVLSGNPTTAVSPKLQSLLRIAAQVQKSGKEVSPGDVDDARRHGATNQEIHDTVLIAATFSMFNRYVDGLNSFTPDDPDVYAEMGERMALGYHFPVMNNK